VLDNSHTVVRYRIRAAGRPFDTNVNILRAKTPGVDIEDLRKGYRGELASIGATGVTDSKPIKLDGDDGPWSPSSPHREHRLRRHAALLALGLKAPVRRPLV